MIVIIVVAIVVVVIIEMKTVTWLRDSCEQPLIGIGWVLFAGDVVVELSLFVSVLVVSVFHGSEVSFVFVGYAVADEGVF